MAAPSIGTLVAQKSTRREYVKGEGTRVILEYTGTEAQLALVVLPFNPLSVDISGDGPVRTLTAVYTANVTGTIDPEQYDLLWEFDCNDIEKSLFEYASSAEMASVIKEQVGYVESGESTYTGAITAIQIEGGTADDEEIFALVMAGTDSAPYSAAVIRLNVTFDKASVSPAISYTNINRQYTTEALVQENPSLLEEPVWLSDSGYWLKRCPRTARRSDGRYQLTQEWWWSEDYSAFIYGAPIEAT